MTDTAFPNSSEGSSLQATPDSSTADSAAGLIEVFVSAMINFATLETAQYAAKQSAATTNRSIRTVTAQNNVYLTPDDMTPDQREQFARASFDANLQKIQSDQLAAKVSVEVSQLDADANRRYLGKKVSFQIVDPAFDPIESYWYDQSTGQYSQGSVTMRQVKGTIHELSLYKNLIVLKPSLYSRVLFPKRKFYFVYVVNPKTLLPSVRLVS